MKRNMLAVIFIVTIAFCVLAPLTHAEKNLLANGDFEQGPVDQPVNWRAENGAEVSSYFGLTDKKVHSGKYALMIKSDSPNDARMFQSISVKPNTYYCFSGWIAVENVAVGQTGAVLSIWGIWDLSPSLNGVLDWTYRELNFKTHSSQTEIQLLARLGMWGSVSTGTAYYDDLSLVQLKGPPATFAQINSPQSQTNSNPNSTSGPNWWLLLILIIIIAGIVRFLLLKKKNQVSVAKTAQKKDWASIVAQNLENDDTPAKASLLQDRITGMTIFGYRVDIKYIILILILVVGIFMRVYEFGAKPPGLNQDEVSSGYDTYCLANYGIDRNGQSFPVHLISWGSGQNALYAYIILPFVKIFGISEVTVRLGNLLLGLLTLLLLFLTIKKILNVGVAILTTFIYAISPWGIMTSRWGVPESSIPFIVMIGVYFYVISLKKPKFLMLSFLFFSLSLYAYGVAYFVIPIFIVALSICSYLWAEDKKIIIKNLAWAWIIFTVVAIPIALFIFSNILFNYPEPIKLGFITIPKLTVPGLRYSQVIALDPNANNLAYIFNKLSKNIFYYWYTAFQQNGPNSLVIYNSAVKFGTIYLISNFFFFIGFLVALFETIFNKTTRSRCKYLWIFLIWFILSTILGVINETNTCRLSVIFIPMIFFTAYGIYKLAHGAGLLASRLLNVKKKPATYLLTKILVLLLIGFIYLNVLVSFANYYFIPYADQIGHYFHESFKEAIEYTVGKNPDNKTVYVTDFDQPYIYVLFYTKYNPHRFLETVNYLDPTAAFRTVRSFGNYRFISISGNIVPEDNSFYIVTHEQLMFLQAKSYKSIKEYKRFTVVEY